MSIDLLIVGSGDGHSCADDRDDVTGRDGGLELVDLSLAKGHDQNGPMSVSSCVTRDDDGQKPDVTRSALVAR